MPVATDVCPVMLFSGKGGVGKTTLAAATAVRLAALGSRVLVISTDPAHSLSDVFSVQLGSSPRSVMAGLDAMEVDARSMFFQAMNTATSRSSSVSDMLRMVSETPGVDEFGAIEVLLQAMEQAAHDVVILDTAPTGHTLRLLMLPGLLDGWFGKLLQMKAGMARAARLVRRLVPGSGGAPPSADDLGRGLEGGRQRMSLLKQVLTDPERAQVVLVTIPEAMSVLETTRTLHLLAGHGIPVGTIVVNQLQPASEVCDHCNRRRQVHIGELERMRAIAGALPVRLLESLPQQIQGPAALLEVGNALWGAPPLPGNA